MSKLFSHYDSCFGVTTYLFLGSQDDILKELTKSPIYFNKQSLEDLVANIRGQDAGLTVEMRGNDSIARYLILMPDFTYEIDDYVTLQHECSHAAHLALLERHISDFKNEDCYHCLIYFTDSLYRAFMTKLNKWHKDEENKKEKEEKEKMNDNIESVVSNEEESTADVELKKEIEKKEKAKKNKKK